MKKNQIIKLLVFLKQSLLVRKNQEYHPNKFNIINYKDFRNTFFGYYDVSPFNQLNELLFLFHANNINPRRKPSVKKKTFIGYSNISTGEYKIIDTIYSWNWQQGARPHWLDSKRFIYNQYDRKRKKIFSKIYDIELKSYKILQLPVNACYKDVFYLTLDYFALTKYSEYGYSGMKDKNLIGKGIIRYDFENKCNKEIVSYDSIISLLRKQTGNLKNGHINHICIENAGEKFVFLYRFYENEKRVDNLFLFNMVENNLVLLVNNQTISHYTWRDSNELFLWGVINGEYGYFLLNVNTGDVKLQRNDIEDGHPSFISNNLVITDCYPDNYNMHRLYLIDLENNTKETILELYHPPTYFTTNRCDFHPSLSISKKYFQIDTRFKQNRSIVIGEI